MIPNVCVPPPGPEFYYLGALSMRFAVFDHNDSSGRPPATQPAEPLSLIEADEAGDYAYQLAERSVHPLGIPTPDLLLAERPSAPRRSGSARISILP